MDQENVKKRIKELEENIKLIKIELRELSELEEVLVNLKKLNSNMDKEEVGLNQNVF